MPLKTYRAKRHFKKTPEPKGQLCRAKGALRFVVQKHDASRLHYDFRLEMDGVLKSWAVPKGPSLNPADKRLAIEVEDHPFDYRTFEGTIPAGNYGAGTVMVWDEGTYEVQAGADRRTNDKLALEQWQAGHLRFTLDGAKLHGEFALVRIRGGKGKNWLLIKHRDDHAQTKDVLQQDRSATTQRTLDEITAEAPSRPKPPATKKTPAVAKKGRAVSMPHHIKPMLATLVAKPFDRPDWFFEVKWDGFRAIAEVEAGKARLYSRNQKDFEKRFAPIVRELEKLKHDAVLDGEIVVLDEHGIAHFQLLQNYQRTGRGQLIYYVFDLLYLDGADLRSSPLRRRKELLAKLLPKDGLLRYSDHIEKEGSAFFKAASERLLEGVMAKSASSLYQEGYRSTQWLKIKAQKQQEAVIAGFTEPRGSRRNLGALILGVYDGKDLVYIGHAGGRLGTKDLKEMRARLEPLEQSDCPLKSKPKTNAPVHWVKPQLICEVSFQEWTSDGIMRQPIFLGLRDDKDATKVMRELPKPLPAVLNSESKPRKRNKSHVTEPSLPAGHFTNLDKVYWPVEGYTKKDLLDYDHAVAPFILPYLHDRPLSLLRHPNGINGASFFQKDVSAQPPPAWVQTAQVASESARKRITYVVCQKEETLLYIANLGCIEINPWSSRLQTLDYPDYLIIDLDPQGIDFVQVVAAAQSVRKAVEKAGLECYCKTSGKRGLHVLAPLDDSFDYAKTRELGETIARTVHGILPESTSLARSPSQRPNKVYLDYLQNGRGQTIVAPYSLRPVAGAPVSTPLRWSEVKKSLSPLKYNLKTIRKRLDKLGDVWEPFLKQISD